MTFFLICLFFVSTTVVSGKVSLVSSKYDSDSKETTFTYSIDSPQITHWVLGVESCPQISPVSTLPATPMSLQLDKQTQIRGIQWFGKVSTYSLKVAGHVAKGSTSFGIVYGAYKSTTGVVEGPVCSYYEDVVCNAGGPYYASCHNNQLNVHLIGHGSAHAAKYLWAHFIPGASLLTPNSVATVLTLPTDLCLENYIVRLTVEGRDSSDKKTCITHVIVEDKNPPTIRNIYERDISVEPHDIPVPMLLSADDECDSNVEIKFREDKVDSDVPCAYQLHRTWSAFDNCGNKAVHTQIISVVDTLPPTLSGVEEDGTYSCDAVPPPCQVEGNDYNDVTVAVKEIKAEGPCDCTYSITRKWTATDCAGNTASKTQKISVYDDKAPTIFGVPADTTVNCNEVPSIPSPSATDNCCGATIKYFDSKKSGSCIHNYELVRTWTAYDSCGNSASQEQHIIVADSEPPVLSGVGEDLTVQCDEVPLPCEVDVSDNCDKHVPVVFSEKKLPGSCDHVYVLSWVWEAVDVCGNTNQLKQMITVVDTVLPVFTGLPPTQLTVDCDALPTFTVKASDNCASKVTVTPSEQELRKAYPHDYTVIKKWDATDQCGNVAHYESTLTVQDNDDPVLIGVPEDLHASCDTVPDLAAVEGTDNCCEEYALTVKHEQETVQGSCKDSYLLIHKWTLEDCDHNFAHAKQTITVEDSQSPVLHSLPGYDVVKCNEIPKKAVVTVTDNCAEGLTVEFSKRVIPGSCKTQEKILRTWSASDACGNTVSYTQTIVTYDDEAPVISNVPSDTTVDCVFDSKKFKKPLVKDNCDEFVTIHPNEKKQEGSCEYDLILHRDWFVEDDCGNVASASQTVTVQDIHPPHWVKVPDEMITSEYPTEPAPPKPLAVDNCESDPEITFNERKLQFDKLCAKAYRLVRAWFVIDLCGNVGPPIYQHVLVDDKTPPKFLSNPVDTTVECDNIPPPYPVHATDHYEDIVVSLKEETIFGSCNQDYDIKRTWIAADSCGNVAKAVQIVVVEDSKEPVMFGVPSDTSAECETPPPALVTAEDNCDGYIDVSLATEKIVKATELSYDVAKKTIYRHWTVSDNCGNVKNAFQTIKVYDTKFPYFGKLESEILVECDDVPEVPSIDITDDCDPNPTKWFEKEDEAGTCLDPHKLIRKWTVADNVGHTASFIQTITIVDTTPPVLAMHSEDSISVECHEVPKYTAMTATDNCDTEVEVNWKDTKVSADYMCEDQYILFWTWTAKDDCGNAASYTKTITVEDKQSPTLYCDGSLCKDYASTFEVECDDDFLDKKLDVTAKDNCDDNVTIKEIHVTEKGSCDHAYLKISSYTGVDNCGNEAKYIQSVTVVDTTPPIWIEKPKATRRVPYTGDVNCPAASVLKSEDNCEDDVVVTCTSEIVKGICPQDYTKTCTCKATDNCGNTIDFVQVINVYDDEPPQITKIPDTTVECLSNLVVPKEPPVNWGYGKGKVSVKQKTIPSSCEYAVIYTWTAVDDCKLKASVDQTIHVVDETPPKIFNVPIDETVDCHPDAPPKFLSGEDNCDGKVLIVFDSQKVDVTGPYCYKLIRTWQAVDHCGHVTSEQQTVVVDDKEPPKVVYPPSEVTTDCHSVPYASEDDINFDDNCEQKRNVKFTDKKVDGTCDCEWTQFRTWDVCDSCGNCVSVKQTVHVIDNTPPSLSLYPGDLTVETTNVPYKADVLGSDTYGSDLMVKYTETRENSSYAPGSTYVYILYRSWSTKDQCGNEESKTQTITVVDTVPVKVIGVPKDITLECVLFKDLPNMYATDTITAVVESNIDTDNGDTVTTSGPSSPVDGTCDNEWEWVRCWETADHAGNKEQACLTINTVDNVPPHFTKYPEVEYNECQPTSEADAMNSVSILDNCDCKPTLTVTTADNTKGYSGNMVRTWTATDCCGLTTTHLQTIWISDTKAPKWDVVPQDTTACCDDVPAPLNLTATDECHPDVKITTVSWKEIVCEGEYVLFYAWRAVDSEGNWVGAEQQVHVKDCKPPVLYGGDVALVKKDTPEVAIKLSPDHIDKTVDCPWVENHSKVYAKDDCTQSPWEVPLSSVDRWGDDCKSSIAFNWVTSDDCGNEVDYSQTIIVEDKSPPVISGCPVADVTLPCGTSMNNPYVSGVDDCDVEVALKRTEKVIKGSCEHDYQVVVDWVVRDRCGFEASCEHTVTYEDQKDPVLTLHAPATVTTSCEAPYAVPSVSATDDCLDFFDIKYDQVQVDGSCPCEYQLHRKWEVADKCGKAATATQTVVVEDKTPPILSGGPKDITVPCNKIPTAPHLTATDNCCESTLEYEEEKVALTCEHNYLLVRTWKATDECGLSTEYVYTVTVEDTELPEFTLGDFVASYVSVECENVPVQPQLTAYDVCSGAIKVVPKQFTHPNDCADSYFLFRQWDAHDLCGNAIHLEQTIAVTDKTPPVIKLPDVDSYECDSIPTSSNHNVVATDNCDANPKVTYQSNILGADCSDNWSVMMMWIAVDRCGNDAVFSLVVSIDDTTYPKLKGVPADTTVECNLPDPPHVTVDDNCDKLLTAQFEQTLPHADCAYNYIAIRRWSASDRCQNTVEETQSIRVLDDGKPTLIGVPKDTTIDCKDQVVVAHVTAQDKCEQLVDVDVEKEVIPGSCPFQYVTVITWTAKDKCGNMVSESQTVTVHDNEKPKISPVKCPSAPVLCDAIPGPPVLQATDDCSVSENYAGVQYSQSSIPGTCDNDYKIVRVWLAVDECGNKESQTCTISVIDNVPPTLVGYNDLPDRTDPCNDVTQMISFSAEDNCGGYVQYTEKETTVEGSCAYDYTLRRTYTAVDVCGNKVTKEYRVTVTDADPPSITYTPSDETHECATYSEVPTVTAEDSCGYAPKVTMSDVTIEGDCPETYIKIRTWTATDECAKTDEHIQTVHYVDTTPPVIDEHEDVTCEIGNIPPPWKCTWTDNCDEDGSANFTVTTKPGSCPHEFSHTYSCEAQDCAGNVATSSHVIHVFDFTPPVLVGIGPDTTVEYQNIPDSAFALKGVSATDNSDGAGDYGKITLKVKPDVIIPGYDKNDFVIVRTYYAVDQCSNRVEHHRTITVVDKTPPCFDEEPGDVTVECDAIPEPCEVFTVGEDLTVDFSESRSSTGTYQSLIQRSWKACDHSGNCHQHHQQVVIIDSTPPVFTRQPRHTTYDCDCEGFPAMANLAAIDNCDDFVVVTKEEETPAKAVECEDSYLLIRKWTATDHKGLFTTYEQSIVVVDREAPTFAKEPHSTTYECDQIPPGLDTKLKIFDNCDDNPTLRLTTPKTKTLATSSVHYDACQKDYHYSATAEDDCGNSVTKQWSISIEDREPPVITGSKHCIHNRTMDAYGSSKLYKKYQLKDLVTHKDSCTPSYITGVWFNRSLDQSNNLLKGALWRDKHENRAWDCSNGGTWESGDQWSAEINTEVGASYVLHVSVQQSPCVSIEEYKGIDSVGRILVKWHTDGVKDPPRFKLKVSPGSSDPELVTFHFGPVDTNRVVVILQTLNGVVFRGIPAIENYFRSQQLTVSYVPRAVSVEPPMLKTFLGEGLWVLSEANDNYVACEKGLTAVSNEITNPCGALSVVFRSADTKESFRALSSFRNSRYSYQSTEKSWRSITHYSFSSTEVWWVVTDYAPQNPSSYAWISFPKEIQKQIDRYPKATPQIIFGTLKTAGVIDAFWKEVEKHSPVASSWGNGVQVGCTEPETITNMQCQGACYYLGYSTAVLYDASSLRSPSECFCGSQCTIDHSRRNDKVNGLYTLYNWLEGFYYNPSLEEVYILAHTESSNLKIYMWVEVSDLCGNKGVGVVEFWIAPSLEDAAAGGRTCDESDVNPDIYTGDFATFAFTSDDRIKPPRSISSSVTFQSVIDDHMPVTIQVKSDEA